MDIVTHTMVGTILAAPLLPGSPLTGICFVLGSVLPDTDALSRLFGKNAFLRWHQTYTHSVPLIVAFTVVVWIIISRLGIYEIGVPIAIGAGRLLHALMDATNTYGVALFAPFSSRRFCSEWVFFIDATVIAVSMGCLLFVFLELNRQPRWLWAIAIGYGIFLVGYWIIRWLIHRRAARLAPPATRSLIPSALLPWCFFGLSTTDDCAEVFALDAIAGAVTPAATYRLFDSPYSTWLNCVHEYGLMRSLSKGYFAVEATESSETIAIVCRDLRIRNFGGVFGRLELTFDRAGKLLGKVFHV
ncbi:MAG TPA: metal-dependent hydrolase [Pirellulales bacterium]|jgi:membrane-bound metal-dependent hydrolase YbcI (DUF457 family)|nr:metal-dependent hydrolase [Pirellulales bacterium]